MTGRYLRTEDGRLLSLESEITYDGIPVRELRCLELEDGPDLTQHDSRFPPPLPHTDEEAA